jgi:hypothetical protein
MGICCCLLDLPNNRQQAERSLVEQVSSGRVWFVR